MNPPNKHNSFHAQLIFLSLSLIHMFWAHIKRSSNMLVVTIISEEKNHWVSIQGRQSVIIHSYVLVDFELVQFTNKIID